MDKVTKNAGYFLARIRDQCSEYIKTHVAGDYEAAMKAIIEIIEQEQNAIFKKDEESEKDEHGNGRKQ